MVAVHWLRITTRVILACGLEGLVDFAFLRCLWEVRWVVGRIRVEAFVQRGLLVRHVLLLRSRAPYCLHLEGSVRLVANAL